MAEQKVRAIMIIEIAGRPIEYIKDTLKAHIEQLRDLKDKKLINYTISEAKKIEAEQEIYTCFAEVEIETDNLAKMVEIVFDFLPSSIEILEPSHLDLDLNESTVFLNDLAGRLHKYDEVAKVAQLQNQQLSAQLQFIQQRVRETQEKEGKILKEVKKIEKPVKPKASKSKKKK